MARTAERASPSASLSLARTELPSTTTSFPSSATAYASATPAGGVFTTSPRAADAGLAWNVALPS
jgi:hypothetical protein